MSAPDQSPDGGVFRDYESRDRSDLEAMLRESDPEDYLLPLLDHWLAQPGILLALEGSELVGVERLELLGDGEAWVGGIRTRSRERGKGWGRRLTGWALERARLAGVHTVRLIIEDSNVPSRRVAERLGFRSLFGAAHAFGRHPSPVPTTSWARAEQLPAELDFTGPGNWIPIFGGLFDAPALGGGRFVSATRHRLEAEIGLGHLYVSPEGLAFLLGDRRPAGGRGPAGAGIRAFAPFGPGWEDAWAWASAFAAREGSFLDGFLPVNPDILEKARSLGYTPGAAWGERVHAYEVEV